MDKLKEAWKDRGWDRWRDRKRRGRREINERKVVRKEGGRGEKNDEEGGGKSQGTVQVGGTRMCEVSLRTRWLIAPPGY